MTEPNDKLFPAYGCNCDLGPDEPLDNCVINEGRHADCNLAVTSHTKAGKPRLRRSPASCKHWVKNADAEPFTRENLAAYHRGLRDAAAICDEVVDTLDPGALDCAASIAAQRIRERMV